MTAEHSRTADFDGPHHTPLFWRQRVREPKRRAVLAEDLGHLQQGPRH